VQQTAPPSAPESVPSDPETLRELGAGIASTCAGFTLRRASRAVTQHFDHALAPVGLRTTQFTLLGALALGGPVSINALARGLVMDRTTLTRNLRVLRDAGLVETRTGRGGREVQFLLSDEGRDALARAIPVWREAQASIVTAFGETRWPTMVTELNRLVHGTLALDPAEPGANGSATGRAAANGPA
jgi:DNA-binding MarR family transcriptional regulator